MTKLVLLCCLILASLATVGTAFVQPTAAGNVRFVGAKEHAGSVSSQRRAKSCPPLSVRLNEEDDREVNVNLVDDVDAFTLTAVGFGLIAFNFLVLANMGDAGIGGLVARIMNTFG